MTDLQKSPWPGWETVRLIGRGSFGTVYELRRELVDGTTESAAMKVITIPQNQADISEMYGEGYDDESITATFRAHLKNIVAEYSLMRKLDGSANAVNCKDISYIQHSDGIGWDIFIRMELLTPLTKTLSGTVPEETVLKIGRDICSALVLCKKYDIVHRDIKPQNIFISPNGDYKLGDFGIAKTVEKTMGGTKVGTYKYMAPEVYNNRPYGSGADLYSLGLVLYWLLNDRRMPFMPLPPAKILAGQDEEARQRRLSGEPLPPPAHGSAELKAIVLKACAYAPEERFRSAEEMYEALCRCSRIPASAPAEQQEAPAPSPLAPPPPVFEPTVIDNTSAEPEPAPAVHANDPKQRQQVPVQQGHVQKKEEAKKEPPEKKQKKPAGRGITAIITGILLLSCCVLGVYGYMHCWFGHIWQAADCTTGRVCTRCSAIAEEPLGHLWQDATCTTPKTCSRCGAAEGKALGHSWKAATCTAPKTCSRCGITNGKALGHTWEAATCTTPKTCSRCGTTEGKALGHSWEVATCTTPKTCSRCKATEGKALGHKWNAATYSVPKTCSVCGATMGTVLAAKPVSIPFSAEIGSTIEFGLYEQNGNIADGLEPIEWYVISKDKDTNMLLLLSVYGLDNVQYHKKNVGITWAECDVRNWLNSEDGFWGTAFSSTEKERVANTLCKTPAMSFPGCQTVGGEDTIDKVFLLSLHEFWDIGVGSNENWRRIFPTPYALSQGAQKDEYGYYLWWLRTPGGEQNVACDGRTGGARSDCIVNTFRILRPAIWVVADS